MAYALSRDEIDALKLERLLETYMPPPGEEPILLARAKANLDACVSVGITEQFASSVRLIARHVGWSLAEDSFPQLNQSPLWEKLQPTPYELDRLRDMNRLDEALYAYGLQCFERQVAAGE